MINSILPLNEALNTCLGKVRFKVGGLALPSMQAGKSGPVLDHVGQ